ncbi:MAG: PD-(D/E)XK nuclease family protein, partial [Acidimicrobiia bacterium]|nr:PD-(D/E)XK nuclease family protein [Acidimicrobiia bacterium]
RFVEDLAAAVARVEMARGWYEKADAARQLLDRLTGGDPARRSWPDAEQECANRVEAALSRLATLEVLDPDPSDEVFHRALSAELDGQRGRSGRYGEGVMYGPLTQAVGEDLDAVFVVGMAEGDCPAPRRDEALLPDSLRELAGGELALRRDGLHEQHRAFLAALAAAPEDRRYLTFPRGDLRGGRRRLPSRWLLDSVSILAGARVHSTEFGDLGAPLVEVVPSHAAGLLSVPAPADTVDRDLAVLARHVAAGGDVGTHPTAAGIARGLACLAARSSAEFTEWDGNLAGMPVPSPARGALQSATRLERWAACGFRYFLADVLHLDERDDPVRIVELSPLDRGSGVHQILERFFEEVIASGPPDPQERWGPDHHARLREIAVDVLADYERSGRTGRRVNWHLVRDRILMAVDAFLLADDAWRAGARARPVRVELPFGLDVAAPVAVALGGDRRVLFRGRADRVDETEDGRHVVFDYKTGSGRQYEGIGDTGTDPVKAGTALQLGLYSEAARALLGAGTASAYYWMVGTEDCPRHGYDWDDACRARFVEVVTAIVDGIEAGAFPANPGDWQIWWRTHDNCRYCGFDDICPRDRGEQADAKRGAPALAVRRVLDRDAEDVT